MSDDEFTLSSGKALFLDVLQPPSTNERLALRNNGAFRYLAARLRAHHHDTLDPVIRENLAVIMGWMREVTTPENPPKKERENRDENEDEEGDDLTEP